MRLISYRGLYRKYSILTILYPILSIMTLSGCVISCSATDDITSSCSFLELNAPSSLVFINEDIQSLAGNWRLKIDEIIHDCGVIQSSDSEVWDEINSRSLTLDTVDGDVLWVTDSLDETRTQTIGRWALGLPLILDLKITRHEYSKSKVNLFHLIASQISEDLIEGEAWLYALPEESLTNSDGINERSEERAPLYQGQFHLERLSHSID